MAQFNISTHFTLGEMTQSQTATRRGIDNTPPDAVLATLHQLCTQILEPIREAYGHPIKVNSGYRCPKLNAAVGGAKTSQHMTGEAADISCTSTTKAALFHTILQMVHRGQLHVGQLIWEYGTTEEPNWIHVSLPREGKKNNQILYLYNKK